MPSKEMGLFRNWSLAGVLRSIQAKVLSQASMSPLKDWCVTSPADGCSG